MLCSKQIGTSSGIAHVEDPVSDVHTEGHCCKSGHSLPMSAWLPPQTHFKARTGREDGPVATPLAPAQFEVHNASANRAGPLSQHLHSQAKSSAGVVTADLVCQTLLQQVHPAQGQANWVGKGNQARTSDRVQAIASGGRHRILRSISRRWWPTSGGGVSDREDEASRLESA
jgi:hypothetical protein